MRGITHGTVFVDWDTARRVARPDLQRGRTALHVRALLSLQDSLAEALHGRDPHSHYRLAFRLYHGWHRGKTKSVDRLELERQLSNQPLQRAVKNVSFTPDLEYGNRLLCGGRRSLLIDTLRRREDGNDEQKMVDTALVSDLLTFVRSDRTHLALVVGDDDDLLPGIITAEAWGGRVLLARVRATDNQHIDMTGLICRLRTTS